MVKPGVYDFTIYQGSTFSRVITWKDADEDPVDLTGYSAVLQVRAAESSDDVLLQLSSTNGGITLGGAAGTITLALTDEQTALLDLPPCVYQLELTTAGGVVTRLLQGRVWMNAEVVR